MQTKLTKPRRLTLTIAISSALIVGGCSSVPKPVGELASAETAISGANLSGATEYAPVELDRAKTKLEQAKKAVKMEDFSVATRFAKESLADANFARAKADAEKTKKATRSLEESIFLLRKSMNLDTSSNN